MRYYLLLLWCYGLTWINAQNAPGRLQKTASKPKNIKPKVFELPNLPPPVMPAIYDVAEDVNNAVEYYPEEPYADGNYGAVIQKDSVGSERNAEALGLFSCTAQYLQNELDKYSDTCIANGQPLFYARYYTRRLDDYVYISPYTYTRSMFAVIYTFNKEAYLKDAGIEKQTFVYPYDYMISVDAKEKKTIGFTPFMTDTTYAAKRVYIFK